MSVPVLTVQGRLGELDALFRTEECDVQVLLELVGGISPGGEVARRIIDNGVEAVFQRRPLWVDTTWQPSVAASPRSAIEFLDRAIEETAEEMVPGFGQPGLIPVVPVEADPLLLAEIRLFLEHRWRPVVVRVRRTEHSPAELARRLDEIAGALRREVPQLHVVFDEQYVRAATDRRIEQLINTITGVLRRRRCASTTLLAGSTPLQRGSRRMRVRGRPEVGMWRAVQQECPGEVRYGDYGVVHPIPRSREPGPHMLPNPYLHYTVPGATLSLMRRIPGRRGNRWPSGACEQSFLEIADELVHRPEFEGPDFSWGDRNLVRCGTGRGLRVGCSRAWIALATSHHLVHLSKRRDTAGL